MFFGTPTMTEMACNAGETREFTLSDQTHVTLYGKSKITYDKESFDSDRKLKLEGEAFFEVNKKGPFEVDFKNGQVNVLGTKFNVLTTNDEAAIKCFEGKVKVEVESNSAILTQGMGARKTKTGNFSEFQFKADQLPGVSSYRQIENASLEEVCNTLSVYYDVQIVNENVDLNRVFSGQFVQTNIDTALTMIFVPMNISYKRNQNIITISNK
jgi:ferric-dicitrate binding protein FerR (iron transport regulator)